MNLLVLDREENLQAVLSNEGTSLQIISASFTESVDSINTLEVEIPITSHAINYIKEENYLLFQDGNGSWQLFVIKELQEIHGVEHILSIIAECSSQELLDYQCNFEMMGKDLKPVDYLTEVLAGTRWKVGNVEDVLVGKVVESSTLEITTLAAIQTIIDTFGIEARYRIVIDGNKIVNRYVDMKKEFGNDLGTRIEFSKNAESIKRVVSTAELKTALIGIGGVIKEEVPPTEEVIIDEEVTPPTPPAPPIDLVNLEWTSKDGLATTKAGEPFIEVKSATGMWGYKLPNGDKQPRMGLFKNGEITDPVILAEETYSELKKYINPRVTYEVSALDLYSLTGDEDYRGEVVNVGDVVVVADLEFLEPLHIECRVIEKTTDLLVQSNTSITLGDRFKDLINSPESGMGGGSISGTIDGSNIENLGDNEELQMINANIIKALKLYVNEVNADKVNTDTINAIVANLETLIAKKATIEELEALKIKVGTLTADVATIDQAVIGKADIGTVNAIDGKIDQLASNVITTKEFEAEVARINQAIIEKATIGQLEAVEGKIGTLTVDVANINTAVIGKADIADLNATNIKVESLMGISAEFEELKVDVATINTVVAGKITANEVHAMLGQFDKVIAGEIIVEGKVSAAAGKFKELEVETAKIGTLTAELGKINTLLAGNITAENIKVNSIEGNRIKAKTITAGEIKAGTITAESGVIANGTIGNALITDGAISSAKIAKGEINQAHINSATILDAFIKTLRADVITSGTLDCRNLNVTNLRADSITTGSITVEGNNLIHNTTFANGFTGWTKDAGAMATIDTTTIRTPGANSVKMDHNINAGYVSELIPCKEGEVFVGSVYVKTNTKYPLNKVTLFILAKDKNGSDIHNDCNRFNIDIVPNTDWQRLVFSCKIPANAVQVAFKFRSNGSFEGWFTQPMLSRGTIASVWKAHNDELIGDGAIGNDQIGNGAVTSGKLVLEEIFASDGFIENFRAMSIHADQITTGKITGERIDVTGLIRFEQLEDTVNDFTFDTSGNQTFIDGGKIYTNTVTADKINAKGLAISDKNNNTTFEIDKEGEVYITGNMQSTNFNEAENTGYLIGKDGDIVINNATVRGDVLLAQAGITNFGAIVGNENLFNVKKVSVYAPYHSLVSSNDRGFKLSFIRGYIVFSMEGYIPSGLFTVSGKILVNGVPITSGFFGSGKANTYNTGTSTINYGKDGYFTITETWSSNWILHTSGTGLKENDIIEIKDIKFESGDKATPWCAFSGDAINYTRIWAGANFEGRDKAPFRVMQDGTVISTRGEFGGTFTGKLEIGNIVIEDTNSTSARLEIKSNGNTDTIVSLTDGKSYIKSDFTLGDINGRNITFTRAENLLSFNKTALEVRGDNTNVKIDANDATFFHSRYNKGTHGDYYHQMKFSGGGVVFANVGDIGADFSDYTFERAGAKVKVNVAGSLSAAEEITVGAMKIVKRTDTGNEGVDFVL